MRVLSPPWPRGIKTRTVGIAGIPPYELSVRLPSTRLVLAKQRVGNRVRGGMRRPPMSGTLLRAAIALFLVFGSACTSRAPVDQTPRVAQSAHFRFDYYGLDTGSVQKLMRHMESNRVRVMRDLQVDSTPMVLILMHTESSFEARWGSIIKRSGVGFQVQGLSNGVNEVHVFGPWAIGHGDALRAVVLHEFAHAVTLQFALQHGDSSHLVAPGTRPTATHVNDRWLSEAIALYEAGQSTDVNWVRRMRNGDYPTLLELSEPTNSLIYGVGYRLVEYVRLKWGPDGVGRLIRAHGDTQQGLGVSASAFENGWYDWIVGRYLILSPRMFGSSRYSRRVHRATSISVLHAPPAPSSGRARDRTVAVEGHAAYLVRRPNARCLSSPCR